MLNLDCWGKGWMKEAMKAIVQDLWSNQDMQTLEEIVANVDAQNGACIALLKKFGFKGMGYWERT